MMFREIPYYFMSANILCKLADRNSKKLDNETDPNKVIKIVDDDCAILRTLIRKNRHDKKFLEYVKTSTQNLIKEHRL